MNEAIVNPVYLILLGAAAIVVLLTGTGIVFAKFYQRAGADEALVRTGSGGEQVVIGGGIVILPIFHQIMRVSLKSVPLMVAREGKNALVTADKIKATVTTELYVKVEPTKEDVLAAARSFGARNLDAQAVRDLVEGKLTDALRAVAANQRFQDLHANRKEFAEHVQKTLTEELKKNGLNLESVAITTFAQLPISELDPNDVFDAEGRRAITETVEANRKLTNTIKRDTDIAVQQKDVESKKLALTLELEQRKAEAEQQRSVAEYQAVQAAEQARRIAEFQAAQQAEARKAVLLQERAQEQAAIEKQQAIETLRIQQEQSVAKADIERRQAIAVADAAKERAEKIAVIEAQKTVETAEIERAKAVETANILKVKAVTASEIDKQQTVETATISKQIAVTRVAAEQALAEAERAKAGAEKERAEQEIVTVQKTAEAERSKQVALIDAARRAQEERLKAEVEAYRRTAMAEAEAAAAQKQAEATERLAQAKLAEGRAEAEARRLALEAENTVDPKVIVQKIALELVEKAPEIVRELMQPVTKVSDIKVLQLGGLEGFAGSSSNGSSARLGSTSPVGSVMKALLEASALSPAVKSILDFGGVSAQDIAARAKEVLTSMPAPSPASMPASGTRPSSPAKGGEQAGT